MTKADGYLNYDIKNILANGYRDENPRPKYKDGVPAHTFFVTHNVRTYDLSKGEFPITTLRPIAWKSAIKEMFWIYQDKSISLSLLREKYGIKYWDDWESRKIPGTIGKTYGYIINIYDLFEKRVLQDIVNNPYSRYHICSMWQESIFEEDDFDGLKPCCYETIWSVRGEYLDMLLNQRSGDMLTASGAGGVNEVQYAALLMMVSKHTGYKPGVFTHIVANEQIYDRHIEASKEIISRYQENIDMEKSFCDEKILMTFDPNSNNFYDFTIEDFDLVNYHPITPQLTLELGI